jgi:hypothetical protein
VAADDQIALWRNRDIQRDSPVTIASPSQKSGPKLGCLSVRSLNFIPHED